MYAWKSELSLALIVDTKNYIQLQLISLACVS